MCVMRRRNQEKQQANLQIKDLLLNAAQFRRNPSDFQVGDTCPICILEFSEDENIICLPCNTGHIFHDHCIGEWVKRNNNCPLCKYEITKETIEGAELDNIPFISQDLEVNNEEAQNMVERRNN